jgi:hypothetical protein
VILPTNSEIELCAAPFATRRARSGGIWRKIGPWSERPPFGSDISAVSGWGASGRPIHRSI